MSRQGNRPPPSGSIEGKVDGRRLPLLFADLLRRHIAEGPVQLLVSLSGGLDSTALLHLLRFGLPDDLRDRVQVSAAHLDHAMRQDSAADALWVRGLCRAWGVPLVMERLEEPPTNEMEARDRRLDFLERVADGTRADRIVTAHHADDQAETVLFRAVRGTGVHGLAGIPTTRGRWLRPLLLVRRSALHDYATGAGLRWREDPTNTGTGNARARLRRIMPELEEVAPGAVESLVGLAHHAERIDGEREAMLGALADALGVRVGEGRVMLPAGVLEIDPQLLGLLLRRAAAELGLNLDAATTRRLRGGAIDLERGRRLDVVAGAELHRTAEGLLMVAPMESTAPGDPDPASDDAELRIDGETGNAPLRLHGGGRERRLRVHWGCRREGDPEPDRPVCRWNAHMPLDSITFPLTVRGWCPGDRIRLSGGTRKVVRLLSEAGVPVPDRPSALIVADGSGSVFWLPDLGRVDELHRSAGASFDSSRTFWMGITDDGE